MATYEEWLSGRGFATTTIRARTKFYRSRLRDWGTWDVTPELVGQWLGQYEGWSRHTYFNHLCSIYEYLAEADPSVANPMKRIKQSPPPRPRPRPLTERELRGALEAADQRTRAFVLLGYLAGLRAFEIAKFHGRDIDQKVLYVMGKGGQGWAVPTHPVLWKVAQRYPRDGYWFPPIHGSSAPHVSAEMVTYHVGRLFRSVGVQGATHRARHSFGTSLLRSGTNLRVVQELMRHASLSTTAMYLGVDQDEKSAAINGLGVTAA